MDKRLSNQQQQQEKIRHSVPYKKGVSGQKSFQDRNMTWQIDRQFKRIRWEQWIFNPVEFLIDTLHWELISNPAQINKQ